MKVLKIGAVWCNSCLVMRPLWAEIEKENPWLKTQYFDFDKDSKAIKKFNIKSGKLPVFIFLDKNGNEFLRQDGEIEKKVLIDLINQYRNK